MRWNCNKSDKCFVVRFTGGARKILGCSCNEAIRGTWDFIKELYIGTGPSLNRGIS